MKRIWWCVAFLMAGCGVAGGKTLSELDANERAKICEDVPKETAVCSGLEVTRGRANCEVTLASVNAACDVTVDEFEERISGPICASFDAFDEWDDCFREPNSAPNNATTNNATPNNAATNNSATNVDPNGDFHPDFLAITQILTTNCALAGCHGNPAAVALPHNYLTGVLATPAEIEAVLSSSVPTVSGNRLIDPGSTETSEIYVRISKPVGDQQKMGAGTYGPAATPLADSDIALVERWISDGAPFR